MPFYILFLMICYDNWSKGMWIYFAMHGSYGILWLIKSFIFPDKTFEEKVSITCAIKAWLLVLAPYTLAAYKVASSKDSVSLNPHPERIACALLLYIFGNFLLLGTDAQKNFVLIQNEGLITDGFFALSRNLNYLGDFMVYSSFNVIAQSKLVWTIYLLIWCLICSGRMITKDYRLSKKEGWETYKQHSWILFPKLIRSSSVLTLITYFGLTCIGIYIKASGGIQATLMYWFG